VVALVVGVVLITSILVAVGHFGVTPGTAFPSPGPTRCQHVGGGQWETVWNNSSRTPPILVWHPEAGTYWVEYNNTTRAIVGVDWGTYGVSPGTVEGTTIVNVSDEAGTVESMMEQLCSSPNLTLPWHYDVSNHLLVRDPSAPPPFYGG